MSELRRRRALHAARCAPAARTAASAAGWSPRSSGGRADARSAATRCTRSTAARPAASRWPARRACTRPTARRSRCGATRATSACASDLAATRSRELARRLQDDRGRARPGRDRLLHLRPAADRGLLRGQQARQGLPRHQQRRLQLAPVHVERGRRLHGRARLRRPAAVLRRPRRRPTACSCSARTPRPATRSSGRGSAAARQRARRHRRRPAPHADGRGAPTCTCRCGPGTDLPLLNAMLARARRATASSTARSCARHTDGAEEALAAAARVDARARGARRAACRPRRSSRRRGAFGRARRAMALWSMGANQSTVGTLKNRALINLCLATGNIGRPGTGPLSLTGQPNAMGGRETGGLAHLLPGYRKVDRPRATAPRCAGCGTCPPTRPASRPAPGLAGDRARRRARGRPGEGRLDRRHEPGRLAARRRALRRRAAAGRARRRPGRLPPDRDRRARPRRPARRAVAGEGRAR